MVNRIWLLLFIIGICFGILNGRGDEVGETILQAPINALDLMFNLTALLILWSGVLRILQDGGAVDKLAKLMSKVTHKLFPELPKDSQVHGFIATNIIANILGLGSAATPFGIKAMKEMQELNKDKESASNSMITLLLINTSGLTLIPTTIISMRKIYNSSNPSMVIPLIIIATTFSTIFAITIDYFIRKFLKRRGKK